MEKRHFRPIALILSVMLSVGAKAQNEVAMADVMRENGKIYVVVAVVAIIFVGIAVYLISIDRKTNRLQKQVDELKK
jgi:CcmD family protein